MEEMIKQWEVFHQSIETRIDEHVVRHIDQVNPKFTCFTGTKAQVLALTCLPGS